MPARTGKGRRRKGRAFELKIIKDLWRSFEGMIPWKLNESPDDGFRPPPSLVNWHLEMKNQESLNIWAALKQAESQAPRGHGGEFYAVIFTRSRHETYVAIPYETWKFLLGGN